MLCAVAVLGISASAASSYRATPAGSLPSAAQPSGPASFDATVGTGDVIQPIGKLPLTAGAVRPQSVPGELIVRFEPGVSRAAQRSALSAEDLSLEQTLLLPRTVLVRVPQGASATETAAALAQRPDVAYAEPNEIQHIFATPNDPRFGELWGLHNTGQVVNGTAGTPDADIDAPEAWNSQTGSSSVVVGVIDTGISFSHPDLASRIWSNPGETGGGKETNGIDDDGNGFVDDYRGWSFVQGNNYPVDGNEHGTHVSGTIGAVGNNGIGIAGVNWNVRIMPIQVCGSTGSCATSAIVNGIMYAGANGASVANMSLGGSTYSQAERDAIAANPNTLYAVASGNSGWDLNAGYDSYPCEFALDNIVCVAASTQSDSRASFSNVGVQSVDLAAPGTNILSTVPAFDTIFFDDFEGTAHWDYTDGPPQDALWERTTEGSPPSGTHSITDSAGANYKNNANAVVTMTSPFSLAGRTECRVDYKTNIQVESFYDSLRVEAATSASGPWTQLDAWDGTSSGNYITLSSDLGAFSGQSAVYLRFRLVSDATNTFDGAYIDDVRVLCPGTSYTGNEYAFLDGTSMATPHVTGAAALLKAEEPKATPGRLKAALLSSVDPVADFATNTVSGGRLNVAAALAAIDTTQEPAPSSQAALDTSFGSGGKVTTSFGTTDDRAFAMARQSDGKLVVVGRSGAAGAGIFAVARYNTDGSLDTSFDGDGMVTTAVGCSTGASDYDEAHTVAIQPDGKIVVAGVANNSTCNPGTSFQDFAVVRYNSDGSLDTTFSGDGKAFANNNFDEAWAVALQSDGKIVVAGKTGSVPDSMVARFNSDGSLDTGFGTGGKVVTTFVSDTLKYDEFHAVALQSDGKIVAAGFTEVARYGTTDRDFALARYNTDGSLDTSFDGDGKVTTSMYPAVVGSSDGTGAQANAVLVQGDGKIVATGGAFGNLRFALARYNTDGSLDTSFDGDGKLLTDVSPVGAGGRGYALALQADGKLVAAGIARDTLASTVSDDFGLARFNANGSLDSSFNGDGKVTTPIAPDPEQDIARGIVLAPEGSIAAAGWSDMASGSSTDYDFSVVRYVPNADTQAPSPPVFTRTDPASPGNSTTPMIKGAAEAGSTVKLYTTSNCSGTAVATGSAASFLSPGFQVTVPPNATTTFWAKTTDASGNASGCSTDSISYTEDSISPETTIESGPSGTTSDSTPTFTFSASEAATFQCRADSGSFASCSSPYTTAELSDGAHTFQVKAIDLAGNADPTPASRSFTVLAAPETSIDSGPSGLTNDSTPTFTFSTDFGTSFECRVDAAAFAACSSPYTTAVLTDGAHTFEVRAIAGGRVDPTPASRSFTVDTVAPQTTIDSGPSGPTNDSTPTFTFSSSEGGSTFQCRVDSGSFAACSSPYTTATLTDGAHTFEVRATDPAGNTDLTPASRSFTVDATAPQTTVDSGPSGPTNDSTPTFTFSSSEGGSTFQCRIDSAAFAACSSPWTSAPLADGPHTFEVKATDAAGNTDATPASRSFTVDTVAPQTTIDWGPGEFTGDNTPGFGFSSNEAGSTFECRVDSGSFLACTSPKYTGPFADGAHTFQVRATDAAGNTDASPASQSFTVDTVAPTATIDSGPSGPTNDATPTFTFSAGETATFECRIDAGTFASCSSPVTTTTLADGAHTFQVRATDQAGNLGAAASRSFTVDTVAPDTTVLTGASGPTNDSTPTFTFSSSEGGSTFQCRIDSAAFAACSSPWTSAPLADGPHTFEVKSTDAAGNTDATPASRSFTVDTAPPETTIDSGPSGVIVDPTPTFTFSSEPGASFQCRVDSAPFAACTSPHTTATLTDGPHTFDVRAVDAAGNADPSPASRSFTLDTGPPETTIDSGPSGLTNDATPTFAFSASEPSSYECRIDSAAFTACSSPWTSAPLADGQHTFEVRATDGVGHTDATPAIRQFTLDTVPPGAQIDSGPSGLTGDPTPTFTFSSEPGASFQCRVDSGAFAGCSSPYTTSALADGAHTFQVRAIDTAGNVGAAVSRSFTIDATAPDTTILSGPTGTITATTATFTFSASEPATFQCRLDGAAFAACTSPYTTPALAVAGHTFDVRAIDAAGNVDPTPASRAFAVAAAHTSVAIVSRTVTVTKKHVAKITLRCGAANCRGTLTLSVTVRSNGRTSKLQIGSKAFSIAAGRKATVAVKLTTKGYRLLVQKRKLAVHVKITHKQPTGGSSTVTGTITLKAPKR
ncbi:MAG: Ig-like domain-containing protein [Gaiellaceae bacterium]